jgi:enoyl-CoA hydratase/carnithine racemase
MAADTGKNVDVQYKDGVARLTLARADKLNPLDWATVQELKAAVTEIDTRPDVFAVVVTGRGRSFSAGGDLDGYLTLYRKADQFAAFLDDFFVMLTAMEASPKIYIAAVNGVCVAGGIELLLACDLSIAADTAKIGDGHLNFGQLPGAGSSQRLPRAIGLLRAKHLMLTGDLLSAEESRQIGLINEVVPAADLDAAVNRLLDKLRVKSRAGLRGAKHLANVTLSMDLETGLKHEIEFVHRYATTEPDAIEGLKAFRDKRKPAFLSEA